MAQLAVAGGGAAIGAVAGSFIPGVGTLLGAQIGWALGGVAGALLFPQKQPDQSGPRLNDLTVQTSGYGVPIPVVAGTSKLAGNVIWKTEIQETATTRRQGKGGGPKVTTYTYSLSWAVGLCEWLIPPTRAGVIRIWLDNFLVYDTTGQSEVTQVPGLAWRFYDGSETQLPDALIEATVGADNAPAHRGLAYIVFEDVPLEQFGNRMPNVTVEIVAEITQTFPQVNTTPPASPLYASIPSDRTYHSNWAINAVVDYRRGRVYEGRKRSSGGTGIAADELIRVYDLTTMETIREVRLDTIVSGFLPGVPDDDGVGTGLLHMGADGYLYAAGGSDIRLALWKIDPDTWRAVGVFGPPEGGGSGFDDDGRWLLGPMGMASFQVPRLGLAPRNFVAVWGGYSGCVLIDADLMSYVWGGVDDATAPSPIATGLGISPLTYPCALVPGKVRDDGGVELWFIFGRDASSPLRVEITRIRVYSGAVALGGGAALGVFRDDFASVEIAAQIDASASYCVLQSAWWDQSDDTLVITIGGAGNPASTWSRFSTFKWAPGSGLVWKVNDHALPEKHDARGNITRVLSNAWGLAGNLVLQPATGGVIVNAAGVDFNTLAWLDEQQAVVGYVSDAVGAQEIGKRYMVRATSGTLTVGDVVEAICLRAGLEVSDLDVTALTDTLRGYTLPRPTSAREALTPLAAAFQFDAAEVDDVLLFRKRAGSTVATLAYGDLVREDPAERVIEEQRAQDAELPRVVTVRFADIERAWEQGAESWQRPASPTATMGSVASSGLDLPIPITATEAKAIARRFCTAIWRERTRLAFAVGPEHARLVPTDPVMVGTRDGASIRCRIISTQLGANWVTRVEAVTEDAAVYGLTAAADGGSGFSEPTIPSLYYARLVLPDLALIEDDDDLAQAGLREYAFVAAYDGPRFRGVRAFVSADQATWGDIGAATRSVEWGVVTEAPPAPATPWTWDEVGTLTVRMEVGEVEAATSAEVLSGANRAALVAADGKAEIIQFRDVTALGDDTYRLGGLLRGRRGTEDRIASAAEAGIFILLDGRRLAYSAGTTQAATARYHRAVGVFDSLETAATVTKTVRGRAEKPYAPAHISGARDGSNNLTITWLRRTRVGGEWLDGTGDVPLSEASEAYEVDVISGPEAVAATYTTSEDEAELAFDGDNATIWRVDVGALPQWLNALFEAPVLIKEYGVRARTLFASTNAPRDWTLEGRVDGGSWVTVDTRTSQTGWSNGQLRRYAIALPNLYDEFRFTVTAGNGGSAVDVAALELYRVVGGVDIAASTYAPAVKRTIAVTAETAAYSAANQTTDFGAAQPEVFVRVYQMSNIVGRGIAAEAVV